MSTNGLPRRDPVLRAGAGAEGFDPQDLPLRHREILRNGAGLPVVGRRVDRPAGPDREVEEAVVLVAGLGGGVEVDLLDAVVGPDRADAHQLASGSVERGCRRVLEGPLRHHVVHHGAGRCRPQVRLWTPQRAAGLGVHGVDLPVPGEIRVEGRERQTGAEALLGEEVRADLATDVQVRSRRAVPDDVEHSVHVGHVQPPGAVRDLAQVVDPVVALQPAVRHRRLRLGPRQGEELGERHPKAVRTGFRQRPRRRSERRQRQLEGPATRRARPATKAPPAGKARAPEIRCRPVPPGRPATSPRPGGSACGGAPVRRRPCAWPPSAA